MEPQLRPRRGDKTYYCWQGMRQRCQNIYNKDYSSYGGRGIKVDPRWQKYENFLEDMGEKPEGMMLDRINVDGDYCAENCRWASHGLSGLNRRSFAAETAPRINSTTGITGVSWHYGKWRVKFHGDVYRVGDFFEACCLRKSLEIARNKEIR